MTLSTVVPGNEAALRRLCRLLDPSPTFSADACEVSFPEGRVTAGLTADALCIRLDAVSEDRLELLKHHVATCLEEMGIRPHRWSTESPEPDWEEVARQLRKPEGPAGLKTGLNMNRANGGMIQRALSLVAPRKGDSILEIGPGNGSHIPGLMQQYPGCAYTGIDISETMIQAAAGYASGYDKVQLKLTDGKNIPFEDGSFQSIFTVNTLYFWDTPEAYAAEILRVLAPGGRFCLAFAPSEFMKTLPFTQYGFRLYTVEEALNLLTNAGFRHPEAISENETIQGPGGEEVTRDTVFILAGR